MIFLQDWLRQNFPLIEILHLLETDVLLSN